LRLQIADFKGMSLGCGSIPKSYPYGVMLSFAKHLAWTGYPAGLVQRARFFGTEVPQNDAEACTFQSEIRNQQSEIGVFVSFVVYALTKITVASSCRPWPLAKIRTSARMLSAEALACNTWSRIRSAPYSSSDRPVASVIPSL
jgi:hypothetical protein